MTEGQNILKRLATLATRITVAKGACIIVIKKVITLTSTTQSIPLHFTYLCRININLKTRFNNFFAIKAGTKSFFGKFEERENSAKIKRTSTTTASYWTLRALPTFRTTKNRLLLFARPALANDTVQVTTNKHNTPIGTESPTVGTSLRKKGMTSEQNPVTIVTRVVKTTQSLVRWTKDKLGMIVSTRRQGAAGNT